MSDNTHEDTTGPIKTGKQFFWVSVASFVVPFFTIVALVSWINTGARESPGATDPTAKVEARIQPVGRVLTEADKDEDAAKQEAVQAKAEPADEAAGGEKQASAADGKKLYESTCSACHAAGVAGAPKYGDKDAWAPLIDSGMDAMMKIAINGKGAMPPRGGSQASDAELHAAVLYMVSAADPEAAKALAGGNGEQGADESREAKGEAAAPDAEKNGSDEGKETGNGAAEAEAAGAGGKVDLAAGKALYEKSCSACHAAGVAGAPKYGDKDAWAPLVDSGMDAMMEIAINGKGAMPPRGASGASDEELRNAVLYMINEVDPDFVAKQAGQ